MAEGLGVDLVDLENIKRIVNGSKGKDFLDKNFSAKEKSYFERKSNSLPHIATTFAAKEAVFKALGLGWQNGLEIEISRDENGQPQAKLKGGLKKAFPSAELSLSLSFTDFAAMAVAMVKEKK